MNKIINFLKNIRKQSHLMLSYQNKYSFVGIGSHSINNLYPVLNYLRVPLKYIVVRSSKNAKLIDDNFEGIIGTNDFKKVLNDAEVKALFICSQPQTHFALIKEALEHNKSVFVEKPPCTNEVELEELIKIEKTSKGFCLVGMQKRYAPIINIFKKAINNNAILSYNYRFVTGPYPEGDKVLDLFIHPIDLVFYLFGEYTIASIQVSKNDTYFIHLSHNGFIGSIELSTHYSWKNAEENLILNTTDGIYKMENMETLTFEKKSKTILSIPLEKIYKSDEYLQILYNKNSFNPILENNQLFSAGYYNEIKNFVELCENRKAKNSSPLESMRATFNLINKINKKHV